MENEVAGMYLSGHPIDEYEDFINAVKCDKIGDIVNSESRMYKDNSTVHVVCIVSKLKNQVTKSSRMMAFVTVEDRYGSIEALVFPDVFSKSGGLLAQGSVVELQLFQGITELDEHILLEDPKPWTNTSNPDSAHITWARVRYDGEGYPQLWVKLEDRAGLDAMYIIREYEDDNHQLTREIYNRFPFFGVTRASRYRTLDKPGTYYIRVLNTSGISQCYGSLVTVEDMDHNGIIDTVFDTENDVISLNIEGAFGEAPSGT